MENKNPPSWFRCAVRFFLNLNMRKKQEKRSSVLHSCSRIVSEVAGVTVRVVVVMVGGVLLQRVCGEVTLVRR